MDASLPLVTSPEGGGGSASTLYTMSTALYIGLMLEKWYLGVRSAWYGASLLQRFCRNSCRCPNPLALSGGGVSF
ncbi:unnamed protein product [Tuber melanosporum]|uniref:(Perigord truffle) hypothetical protein n=1 Tax=Tuber melanosporum (strain Mel28) TaxID=656061 RepID=D5GP88_TUBMM|nr:uncharacterized protein GSTUM_00011754001 [Tuber melanosporum]CAZ86353.1 unnamed protein product [Tuber melanosporum]